MAENENNTFSDYERLLQKQLDELRVIQDKILQLKPDHPSKEMLGSLYLEVGRVLHEISALKLKQDEMENYLAKKKQNLDKLEAMQEDIERFQEEKQHLVNLLKFRDFENARLRKDISWLTEWMGRIETNYKLLLESRSWRLSRALVGTANRLRFNKKKQTSGDPILTVFKHFKSWQRSNLETELQENELDTMSKDYNLLTGCFRTLIGKTELLFQSRRWKLVSLMDMFIFGPLGRATAKGQTKKITAIFSDFESARANNKTDEIRKLCVKFASYEHNYRLLINSRKWKSSDAVISTMNRFLFRKKTDLVTTAIEDVLAQFKKWRFENKDEYTI